MAKTTKKAEQKNQEALLKALGAQEPGVFTHDDKDPASHYVMADALNYYRAVGDADMAKSFLVEYAKEYHGKDAGKALRAQASTSLVPTFGWLSRMVMNGSQIGQTNQTRLDTYIQRLTEEYRRQTQESGEEENHPKTEAPEIIEQIFPVAVPALDRIDQEIDRYLSEGKTPPDAKLFKGLSFQTKKEQDFFLNRLKEIYNEVFEGCINEDTGMVDREIAPYVKPTMEKKIREFLDELHSMHKKKPAKKAPPKRKKKVDPVKMTKNIKYLKEDSELGLKSQPPRKLVGASQTIIYDTKTRHITVFDADIGGFTVQGTTIKNIASSRKKTVRQQYLSKMAQAANKSHKELLQFFENISATEQTQAGRLSEQRMILTIKGS